MSVVLVGLLMVLLLYALLLAGSFAIVMLLPASFLGSPAKAILNWLPPFLQGEALRNWAATTAERLANERLAGKRTGKTATQLAAEVETGAMHAMLPTAAPAELERIIACPEAGQGMIGVTAPEALSIADFLRKNRSRDEQQRIYEMALENARIIAARKHDENDAPVPACPLSGPGHVCCTYGARPLRCRPLHAISIAKDLERGRTQGAGLQAVAPGDAGHEQTVAQGIELGVTRALKSAGLDADVYEINSALATALGTPNAAERWAGGENIFHSAPT